MRIAMRLRDVPVDDAFGLQAARTGEEQARLRKNRSRLFVLARYTHVASRSVVTLVSNLRLIGIR